MKIEVILSNTIHENNTGMTCFNASKAISNAILTQSYINGVVIIDNIAVKFGFSSMGMDGDIHTNNQSHRELIKVLIPIYVYMQMISKSEPPADLMAPIPEEYEPEQYDADNLDSCLGVEQT